MIKRIVLYPILFLVLLAIGVGLTYWGFARVESLRQMERIPRVTVDELIPGEANLSGLARVHRESLRAPDSGATTLYYRYVVERRTRDADGNTSWETESTDIRMVPFRLEDATGSALVEPDQAVRIVGRSVHSRTAGDRRFTEYRIDPGMRVFAMGYAQRGAGEWVIRFTDAGTVQPILSTRTEEEERGSMGLASVLLTVGGLLGLSLAMYMLTRIVGIHQTLAYLTLVALTIISALLILSMQMMERDIRAAHERVDREEQIRVEKVGAILQSVGAAWDGQWESLPEVLGGVEGRLTVEARERIQRHRINLARSVQRANRFSSGLVAGQIARRQGVPAVRALPLSGTELERLEALEADFSPSRLAPLSGWILVGVGLLGAIILAGIGFRLIKIKRWIENIPTVKTRGVVYGMTEVKGKAVLPADVQPLQGPVSAQPCCYYRYVIRERRRTNRRTEWVTIHQETRHLPFLCEDGAGSIPVDCEGADVILRTSQSRRQGIQQHIEYRVPIGSTMYVLGHAGIDPETHDRLIVTKGNEKSLPFLISDYSADELIARKAARGFLALNFGFSAMLLASFGVGGWLWGFEPGIYMAAALAPLVYLSLFMLILIYNDLVYLRRRCDAMWANIEVALKKRFDLIPRLQSVAQGYLAHERELQESITRLRTECSSSEPTQVAPMLQHEVQLLRSITGALENYPDLKADGVLADVFRRIRDMEDEVALMREGYNHAVEVYESRIQRLPDVLLAKLFRFTPRHFFAADSGV